MPWDADKAVKHIEDKAVPAYGVGKCAAHVREALIHGGVNLNAPPSHLAEDFGPNLESAGFVAQASNVQYQKGDVAVIDGFSKDVSHGVVHDHKAGHMALFDGSIWISDYKQPVQVGNSPYPDSDYVKAAPSFVIYRHK